MSSRFRKIAALFVGLAFAGCSQPTEVIDSPAPPPTPHLSTAVEVSPPTMVTGSLVAVTLSVTNHERRTVTLGFGSGCQVLFVVYDRRGIRVSEDVACTAMGSALALNAGETRRYESVWRAVRYDYGQDAYVPLPPGPYRFRAYIVGHGYLSQPFVVQVLE